MLSEYEIERRDRIARNHDTLVALGLGDTSCFILPPSSSEAESKQTKRRLKTKRRLCSSKDSPTGAAVRKSSRLLGATQDQTARSDLRRVPVVHAWHQAVFEVRENTYASSACAGAAHTNGSV